MSLVWETFLSLYVSNLSCRNYLLLIVLHSIDSLPQAAIVINCEIQKFNHSMKNMTLAGKLKWVALGYINFSYRTIKSSSICGVCSLDQTWLLTSVFFCCTLNFFWNCTLNFTQVSKPWCNIICSLKQIFFLSFYHHIIIFLC